MVQLNRNICVVLCVVVMLLVMSIETKPVKNKIIDNPSLDKRSVDTNGAMEITVKKMQIPLGFGFVEFLKIYCECIKERYISWYKVYCVGFVQRLAEKFPDQLATQHDPSRSTEQCKEKNNHSTVKNSYSQSDYQTNICVVLCVVVMLLVMSIETKPVKNKIIDNPSLDKRSVDTNGAMEITVKIPLGFGFVEFLKIYCECIKERYISWYKVYCVGFVQRLAEKFPDQLAHLDQQNNAKRKIIIRQYKTHIASQTNFNT